MHKPLSVVDACAGAVSILEAVTGILGDIIGIGGALIGGSSAKRASAAAQAAQLAANTRAQGNISSGLNDVTGVLSPYTNAGAGAQTQINSLLGIASPGTTDWTAYVAANPDVAAEWQRLQGTGQFQTPADFGQWHYENHGQAEGRDISGITTGGTDGTEQGAAIAALQASPLYQSLYRTGQEAVLQNGAATGGLRGGNIQNSLANFGRDTLSQTIQQQLANLSGVANSGLAAAGTQANAATGAGQALAGLNTGAGDITAGGILQRSTINANTINSVSKGLGSIVNTIPGLGGIKI